jgi:hypothetical protein
MVPAGRGAALEDLAQSLYSLSRKMAAELDMNSDHFSVFLASVGR